MPVLQAVGDEPARAENKDKPFPLFSAHSQTSQFAEMDGS